MKKLALLAIVLFVSPVFAERQINLTEIQDMRIEVTFNREEIDPNDPEGVVFYPMALRFWGFPTGDGIKLRVTDFLLVGAPQDTPFAPKELYQVVKAKMGQKIADKIKNIYMVGINEDPSLP